MGLYPFYLPEDLIQNLKLLSRQEGASIELFNKISSKNTRFTDCLNMAIMKELKINTIFSFDKHYKQAGFKLLIDLK